LNSEESKALMQVIRIGILSGYLSNENILMCEGQISEIIGLEYDHNCNRFVINEELKNAIKPVKKPIENAPRGFQDETEIIYQNNKKCLIKQWSKYINELNVKKAKKV
jgi:hypothetical protein